MKKGFTLVELLAVIVILAILIVVSVPITNNVINNGKKSAFAKYVDKLYFDVINKYEADKVSNPRIGYSCILYDIKSDLGLDATKDYEGNVIVVPSFDNPEVYFNIHNKQYKLVHFKYINSEDEKSDMGRLIAKYVKNTYEEELDLENFVTSELGCSDVVSNSVEY